MTDDDMEKQARGKVLEILKQNNWYAVVNLGHCGIYFYVLDLSKVDKVGKSITNEVYSTMYEQFVCEYYFDNIVFRFDYSYNDENKVTYADFLTKLEAPKERMIDRGSGVPTTDKKVDAGTGLKAEHPEWYSATGPLGLRDFQIDAFGVKDAEMERHFVPKLDSETINRLDDINRRDMRNWEDRED